MSTRESLNAEIDQLAAALDNNDAATARRILAGWEAQGHTDTVNALKAGLVAVALDRIGGAQ